VTAVDRRFATALVLYLLALAVLPLALSEPAFEAFFSEEGPVEIGAMLLWCAAGAIVLLRIRPLGTRAWAFALLYFAFAAREAELHRAFTADSMLKSAYYRRVPAPLAEKLIAGLVAIALLVLLAYVLWIVVRFLWKERGWRTRSGAWLLVGMALLVGAKLLDRAPAVLAEDFDLVLSPLVKQYASAFEEGIEAALPLILAFSAWIEGTRRHYL